MSDQMNDGPQMSDTPAEQPESAATPSGPTLAEAWDDVRLKLGALGEALSVWAKAAADTPENRQHLDEVRSGVNDMAQQANEAFSAMAGSDFGRQFSEGASQVGQAIGGSAQEFSQAAAPHVASAFAGLADAFGRAAQKVGEAASSYTAPDVPERPAPEVPVPREPPISAQPAAPTPTAPGEPPAPWAPVAPGEPAPQSPPQSDAPGDLPHD